MKVQKNFRLSATAVKLLEDVAASTNLSETDVVEHCLARHALQLGIAIDRAESLLLEHLAQGVSAKQRKG